MKYSVTYSSFIRMQTIHIQLFLCNEYFAHIYIIKLAIYKYLQIGNT